MHIIMDLTKGVALKRFDSVQLIFTSKFKYIQEPLKERLILLKNTKMQENIDSKKKHQQLLILHAGNFLKEGLPQ